MLRRLCINSFTVCVFGVPRSTTDAVWHWAAVAASVSSISPHLVSRDEDSSLSSILDSSFSTVLIHEVHSGTALLRTAAIMLLPLVSLRWIDAAIWPLAQSGFWGRRESKSNGGFQGCSFSGRFRICKRQLNRSSFRDVFLRFTAFACYSSGGFGSLWNRGSDSHRGHHDFTARIH